MAVDDQRGRPDFARGDGFGGEERSGSCFSCSSEDTQYSDDGFWSGRLRDSPRAEKRRWQGGEGPGKELDRVNSRWMQEDRWYRDPRRKTFAYWYVATRRHDRVQREEAQQGHVSEEESSEGEGDEASEVVERIDADRLFALWL